MEDQIFFNEGLAQNARSALQAAGFLKTCENIVFKKEGEQELRPAFSSFAPTITNAIHSIKRFRDKIIIGDSTNLRYRDTDDGVTTAFTSLGTGFANAIFSFREYKGMLHLVNGADNLFFDPNGNLYNAFVANPTVGSMAGAAGAAGNPNGTYALYCAYLITWPDGQQYETGLSSASADVTVSSEKIEWSAIPVSTYAAQSGTAPTIHRKLYRGPGTGGTLADIYLVATITDNTTTTYSDNFTDAQLLANGACAVDTFAAPPTTPKFLEYHYGRLFLIDTTNPNRLYHSEAAQGSTATANENLMVLAFPTNNWDDIRVPGFGRVDPQGLIAWGTYLYIPLKHTWIRKYGNTPSTWSFKKTWSAIGIAAPYSLALADSPTGILGVSAPKGGIPGISIFNGSISQIITGKQFQDLFESDLNIDAIAKCRGEYDGRYYHLLYPSGSNTEPDKHAAFDFDDFPKIRLSYWEDLNPRSIDVYDQNNQVYLGGSGGLVQENTGNESINIDVETVDLVGGNIALVNQWKKLTRLKYNLDSGGDDITLQIYLDGTAGTWPDDTTSKTITGAGDDLQTIDLPPNFECYRYSVKITGSSLTTFKLYGPWEMVFEFK